MTIREIIRMGHPTLRQVAAPYPVDDIGSAAFLTLIEDMKDTLHAAGGIGLAAPQIDVSSQIVIVEILDSGTRYGDIPAIDLGIYINPTITIVDETCAGYWEGCLSIPGMMGFVERPQHIIIDYLDENADGQSMDATGFLATVFQHEFDHLKGRLYVDHIADMTLFAFEQEYKAFIESKEQPETELEEE